MRVGFITSIAVAFISFISSTAVGVDYTVGLRFDDGSSTKTISLSETTTLELFISTSDSSAAMKEFLIGFSSSTADDGGTLDGLEFTRNDNMLTNWDYESSNLTGALTNRFATASASSPTDDVTGSFTELVVDRIEISPSENGLWTLAPNLLNFDVIIGDRHDPVAGNALEANSSSVTLIVPEPTTLAILAITACSQIRRRRNERSVIPR